MTDQYTVLIGDHEWRLATVRADGIHVEALSVAADATSSERVEALKSQLTAMGCADQPIMLALASSWCLGAVISTEDMERGNRRRAMSFRLEEHLPIAAEQTVADYIETGRTRALGVGAELDRLRSIVEMLEAAGIAVRHICPAAMLAAAYAVEQHSDIDGLLLADRDYDLIELHKGRPVQWWWLADDESAVRDQLTAVTASRDQPIRLAVLESGRSMSQYLRAASTIEPVEVGQLTADQAAAHHAATILRDRASTWIDLRRDALAATHCHDSFRKPVNVMVAAVLFLLASILGVTQWRGRQHEALTARYQREQAVLFDKALPDQHVPASIMKSRLRSEERKLAGLTSHDQGGETIEETSALEHLYGVLSHLPTDTRYHLLDLNISPNLIRVNGQARSHVEAERVAVSLRASGAYEVEPPKTQVLRQRAVSFAFSARPRTREALANGSAP